MLLSYIAVYRLVNKVWVIAIAAAKTNPFVVGHIVESATKGLIRACQQVEVTKDLLAKHWVEVRGEHRHRQYSLSTEQVQGCLHACLEVKSPLFFLGVFNSQTDGHSG